MVNEARGEVLVTIGGKELAVRLGFAGVRAVEKATNKSAIWLLANAEREASVDTVFAVLLIALRGNQRAPGPYPRLQEAELLDWMDAEPERFAEWLGNIVTLLALSLRGRKLREDQAAAAVGNPPQPQPELPLTTPAKELTGNVS